MAKKKAGLENTMVYEQVDPDIRLRSTTLPAPVIPTNDARHMTGIRLGKVSGEIFSRQNREKIIVDPDVAESLAEQEESRKAAQVADKKRRKA